MSSAYNKLQEKTEIKTTETYEEYWLAKFIELKNFTTDKNRLLVIKKMIECLNLYIKKNVSNRNKTFVICDIKTIKGLYEQLCDDKTSNKHINMLNSVINRFTLIIDPNSIGYYRNYLNTVVSLKKEIMKPESSYKEFCDDKWKNVLSLLERTILLIKVYRIINMKVDTETKFAFENINKIFGSIINFDRKRYEKNNCDVTEKIIMKLEYNIIL